ncbi:MAG TPA: beta-ketoacyl-ACP synthase III [Gemmatimonadales bacterium]|nr:beta-ketoacyl-ACP synthase III [Gemmatimonadales bacterium]
MMARPIAEIAGLGVAVPARTVTNHDLSRTLDTTDQWIVERTGIRERRIAAPEETLASLCRTATTGATNEAGITAADLDTIILATVSPDRRMPGTACDLQALIGAESAAAFDIHAACPGFIYALAVGEGLIATGQGRNVLTLGAERLSTVVDWQDRSTAVLFGDGAGAVVLQPARGDRGILSTFLRTDGRLANLLYIPGGAGCEPISEQVIRDRSQFMKMAGREVFKAAVHAMAEATDEALRRACVTADEIDLFVPHQANIRIIEATARHAGVPMDKVMVNLDRYGNTSAASIPLALDQALKEGRVSRGSLLLFVAFGAGFTWGSAVVRW